MISGGPAGSHRIEGGGVGFVPPLITPDSFDWRYEATSDGGETWTVSWTLKYTRAS